MSQLTVDRRMGLERRGPAKLQEPLQRQRERRAGDRRESPRVPMRLYVRHLDENGGFVEREGNVGLGGVFWKGPYQPPGSKVEVAFWIPEARGEVRARGRVLRSSQIGGHVGVHVKLEELDVRTELAMAKYLQAWLTAR